MTPAVMVWERVMIPAAVTVEETRDTAATAAAAVAVDILNRKVKNDIR
jgi:hypothetical protein